MRPKIRVSPSSDANYMIMLRQAVIESDRTEGWKKEVVYHLSALIVLLGKTREKQGTKE